MKHKYEQLLDCAVSAARKAGLHALHNSARRSRTIQTFKHDVKLALDVECQQKAVASILSKFPEHAILGEEGDSCADTGKTGFQWIIDPIDGTVNYFHGLTNWCSSVAVRYRGTVVAGAVYIPVADELYTATLDSVSRRNDTAIHVSGIQDLSKSIVMTGLDKNAGMSMAPLEIFRRISAKTQKARVMGAAAADICQVACGRAEGYYESGIYIWDIAAAGLIIERAGGKAEILTKQTENRMSFMASNGNIHSAMRKLVPHDRKM